MLAPEARDSIATLMQRLRPFVERRVPRTDVDDVLQDIFLRMHRGLPKLRDTQRFGPWIYRIVRNTITDRYRTQAPVLDSTIDLLDANHEEEKDTADGLAGCIAPLVARLDSPYREAVTLVDLEGISHKNAATMFGISLPGMKSRVKRGRAKLRALFGECCELELDVRRRIVAYQCRNGDNQSPC